MPKASSFSVCPQYKQKTDPACAEIRRVSNSSVKPYKENKLDGETCLMKQERTLAIFRHVSMNHLPNIFKNQEKIYKTKSNECVSEANKCMMKKIRFHKLPNTNNI